MADKKTQEPKLKMEELQAKLEAAEAKAIALESEKTKLEEDLLVKSEEAEARIAASESEKTKLEEDLQAKLKVAEEKAKTSGSGQEDMEVDLQAKLKAAEEKVEAAELENAKLREGMDTGKFVGAKIKGSFDASYPDPLTGKKIKKKVAFKDGHKYLFVGGQKMLTEGVLTIANGGKVSKKVLEQNSTLGNLTEEVAAEHLCILAKIGYGYLK